VKTHASVSVKMAIDAENFAGFSHAGAPEMMRGSTTSPTAWAPRSPTMRSPTAVSRASMRHNVLKSCFRVDMFSLFLCSGPHG
jgi:hypothetical protein